MTVLRLQGVGKDYGTRKAVGAVELEVVRGECFGLLGPNGAGKTTTISMACGVVTPSRGRIEIGGIDLAVTPFAAKRKLGFVPQDLAIYEELTGVQNLAYFGALYGLAGATLATQIERALDAVGLRERADEPAKQYSGGMKRRLNLAAGLVHQPELLILDEPTVGVDPQSRNHIFETVKALRAQGMTVVYTSHYMEEVEALCDRVAIMDGGEIIATGTIAELIAQHAGKGIELALTGSPEGIAAAATAAAEHGTVVRDDRLLRVEPRAGLAPLVAAIEGAGVTIARIESREATLEAAFLKLTGKSLRDEAA